MATAMAKGLISKGMEPNSIIVADPSPTKTKMLHSSLGVSTTNNSVQAVKNAEVIILSVKPQVIDKVAKLIADNCDINGKVIVSVAAGVSISLLKKSLGDKAAIVRLMPNMPALLGVGMSGLYANENVTAEQRKQVNSIAHSFGECIEVNHEDKINMVTALSGSGPAYFFLLMEEMIKAGISLGLSEAEAVKLTRQTALGAAQLAVTSNSMPAELREQITSKRGTTESALMVMHSAGFDQIVASAVTSAYERALQLNSHSA